MNNKKIVENKNNNFEFYTEIDKKQDIIIPELTFKNIQTEMILFKNDILKDINLITKDITEKHKKYSFLLKDEIKNRTELFKSVENKIKDLSDLLSVNNQIIQKIENLFEFKGKMEEYTITNEIRFNNLEKDTNDNFFRQDKIFKETVFYPGVIGPTCKYKSFHDLLDYFINEITGLLKYKEKNEIDLDLYKNRLEGIISGFKLQIENFLKSSTQFTKKTVNQAEQRINEKLLKYEDLINSNRIQCCKSCTDLENKIIDYKLVNEDNLKNINDKIDKLQKQIHDKINEIIKKQNKNDFSMDYNRKFNKGISKMSLKNANKLIKNSNEKDENNKLDNKKAILEKSDIKENEINKSNKENSNQINYDDIKNLENKMKDFIKNEIKNLSDKIYKSLKKTKDELNLSIQTIPRLYSNKDESYSYESEKPFITKTEIDKFKENNLTNVHPKRYSHVQNQFNKKKIFDQLMKKREEKKILLNRYIFEKIKEVFEESIEDSEDEIDIKMDKLKVKKDYMSIPKIREMFNDPEIQKELIYKKIYNSTKIIPIIIKVKKPKKIKDNIKENKKKEIKPKPKTSEGKKLIKSPIKVQISIETQNTVNIEKKNLTEQKINKSKIEVNENNNKKEHKKRPYSKQVRGNSTTHIHKKKNKIEFREELIKTPKIKRNQHLSNFTITLQGTKKINIDSLDKLINDNMDNINQNLGSTIYMNFPRTTNLYKERMFESLHPLYKNKKYSKYIKSYISAMNNNYQAIFNKNESKSLKEKKKTLAWNKSENNLTKNIILKMKNNKEINLPEIVDDDFIKNNKQYSPLNEDKFRTLIEKDLFKYKSHKNNIQDIYLNKDNRFSQLAIKEKTSFINLKKKI